MITGKDFIHPQILFWDVCIPQTKVTLAKELLKFWLLRKSQSGSSLGMVSLSSAKLAQASHQGQQHTSIFLLRKRTVLDWSQGVDTQRIEMMLLRRVLHPSTSSVYLPCRPQPGSGVSSTESRTMLFCWARWSDGLARCLHCLCKGSVPAPLCWGQEITTLMYWYWNPIITSSGWRLFWVSFIMLIFNPTHTGRHHKWEGTWKDHRSSHQLYLIFPEQCFLTLTMQMPSSA